MAELGQRLWQPVRSDTLLAAAVSESDCADSAALQRWSVTHPAEFWDFVWRRCGVVGDRGSGPAVHSGATVRDDRYFPHARLNYAENLLAGQFRDGATAEAVISHREDGTRQVLTWDELRDQVARCQSWLRSAGVQPGDVVAAWLPNTVPALVTMIATVGMGAVFTSTSPDFGAAGVIDRFAQVEPTVLVAADGYRYAGKRLERVGLLPDIVAALPTLREVCVVSELGAPVPTLPVPVVPWLPTLADATVADAGGGGEPVELVRRSFDTAGFILYSSGTTGRPKCIVHSAAGILLKQLPEHQWNCDIRPGDRVFYFTTCGWMMWNWLVTTLASGATVVLYDGSPFFPDPQAMWRLVAADRVTLFGTSAKFLDASLKAGVSPGATFDLTALRTIASTGSPLSAEGFEFVYREVAPDVHLASISGGTDLCGCFVLGDPTRPVYAGEIQGPSMGTDVDVVTDDGLPAPVGVRGELVCRSSFPSMPLRFVDDADGSRYTAAYFDRFPGVWAHGDFAMRTDSGGFVITGRSDATLNAGGVRIGTAEIYRQVEQLPQVAEALAIGQEWDDDTRIVLFVRLTEPASEPSAVSDDLTAAIAGRLRTECSPRHVPARIIAVPDLPRTRSGKLAELAVADVVHGRPVRNTEALANPDSLRFFTGIPDLAH